MNESTQNQNQMANRVEKSDREWREELTPAQYEVLRGKGTERAFTGAYVHEQRDGTYRCAGCGAELFSSDTKFDSGTGWASFYQPLKVGGVGEHRYKSLLTPRPEVRL